MKKVLIVDENPTNRESLRHILTYKTLEADCGEAALGILAERREEIAAVLLENSLAAPDDFALLHKIREDGAADPIPVLITAENGAEEENAIAMGASDFLLRPYRPKLVLHSLETAIRLGELMTMAGEMKRDKLTGLLNREAFFRKAEELIREREPGYYILSSFDVDNFKVINDQYGPAEGNRILRMIGAVAGEDMSAAGGIAGRISSDNFAGLYPAEYVGRRTGFIEKMHERQAGEKGACPTVIFSVGRCRVTDLTLSASAIYDRAFIAKQSVKGRYDEHVAYFDETMRDRLIREQEITGEMDTALAERQFEVWLQPQFNHATAALIGAEALVRWRHPKRGLIPPDQFIPAFEKNGFIYELDKYVWEQTCRYLRGWLDAGRSPLPVSVNISRYDVFRPDIVEVLTGLLQQYAVPAQLLRLEITESAFAQSSQRIIQVVKKLIDRGFTLELDDFGSGYSSLNTLKDVPASILKLDMRFLESSENSQRGGNILESVVRMAKWLDMAVIAEGVETMEQADFLKSIGCKYIQGYLYAKPMPVEAYEALAGGAGKEERLLGLRTVENLDNNAFWDPASMDTLIFNSYIGGACIFEYCNGKIELLRANDKYTQVIGSVGMSIEDALKLNWAEHMDERTRKAFLLALGRSVATGDEITDEYLFRNLPGCPAETYLRSTIRVIASSDDHHLIYCTNENMTAQRHAEQKEREVSDRLHAIMENVGSAITAVSIHEGRVRYIFNNNRFYQILGYTKEQYHAAFPDAFGPICREDLPMVMEHVERTLRTGEPVRLEYRDIRLDGAVIWVRQHIVQTRIAGVEGAVLLSILDDITGEKEIERKERMASEQVQAILEDAGSGITATTATDGAVRFLIANGKYYEILGFTQEQYEGEVHNPYDLIHPEDRERVQKIAAESYASGTAARMEYRVIRRDGEERWVRAILSETRFTGIEETVQLCVFSDISTEKQAEQTLHKADEQLRFLNSAAHDLLAQPDCNKGIEATLRKLLEYFGGNRAYIFEFDYPNSVSDNTYEVCAPGITSEKEKLQRVPLSIMSFWLHAFDNQSNIHIEDVEALEESRAEERRALRAQGIRSLIAVPLWREGNLIGFLGIDDPGKKQAQVSRLDAIGDYLAVMLTKRDLMARIDRNNAMLLSMMRDMPGGFVRMRIQADGRIVPLYFNDGFCSLVAMNREELMALYAKDAMAGVHPEDVDIVREAVGRMMENGEAHSSLYRLRSGKGGYISVMIFGRTTRGEAGETYLNIYYTDAAEQSKLEEERKELLDNMPCGAALYELDGDRITAVHLNKRYRELVGRGLEDLSVASVLDAVHPDDREPLMAEVRLAIREKRDIQSDIRILYGKDDYRSFRITGRTVPKGNGKFAVYASYTQITGEQASYQQMLPAALAAVMASSRDISFVKDRDLRYICCSRTMARAVGLQDEKEIVGKTDYDLMDGADADAFQAVDREIVRTGTACLDMDEALPAKSAAPRYSSTSKYPLLDAKGNVIGIYGITRDVTEYHTTYERLKLLTDSVPGGIASFEIRPDSIRLMYFNEGFYSFSGYTREEYAEKSREDPLFLIFQEDRDRVLSVVQSIRASGVQMPGCTFRCHTKDGGYHWFSMKGVASRIQQDVTLVNIVEFDITEQKEAEERLRMSEEQFRVAAALSGRAVARYNLKTGVYYNDSRLLLDQGLGREISDVPQIFIEKGLVEAASIPDIRALYRRIWAGDETATATVSLRTPGGAFRWFRMNATVIFDGDKHPSEAIIVFFDVTEQREKEAVYKRWQQSLQEKPQDSYTMYRCNLNKSSLLDTMEGSLLQIRFADEKATFDERTREYARGFVYPEDRQQYVTTLRADTLLADYYRGKRTSVLEYREIVPGGAPRWLRRTVELVEYPDSTDVLAYLMFENIDESKRAELQTKALAETDPLTSVLNRNTFAERMNERIHNAKKDALVALLMFDLDCFKQVNDSFGHGAGDRTLVEMANVLRSVLRGEDLVGRLGGDEFLVCLDNMPSHAAIEKKAAHIGRAIHRAFSGGGTEIAISASIGIAVYPADGETFYALYHKADVALYHVKAAGKDSFAFYKEEMEGETLRTR